MLRQLIFFGLLGSAALAALAYLLPSDAPVSEPVPEPERVSRVVAPPPETRPEGPRLSFPVGCLIGEDCWYMAFVDLDERPSYRDHMCGIRTYNGHKGTDFALNDDATMAVAIHAAAAGKVLGTRDGQDGTPMRQADPAREATRCGNGVRLDHGDGWTTQYCHMAQGSVAVRTGESVTVGQRLGQISSSGWSEHPHLHFQLEKDGAPVDPFVGLGVTDGAQCDVPTTSGRGLWDNAAAHNGELYRPVVIRQVGLTTSVPDQDTAKFDGYPKKARTDAEALVAYIVIFGAPADARIDTLIGGPAGPYQAKASADLILQ